MSGVARTERHLMRHFGHFRKQQNERRLAPTRTEPPWFHLSATTHAPQPQVPRSTRLTSGQILAKPFGVRLKNQLQRRARRRCAQRHSGAKHPPPAGAIGFRCPATSAGRSCAGAAAARESPNHPAFTDRENCAPACLLAARGAGAHAGAPSAAAAPRPASLPCTLPLPSPLSEPWAAYHGKEGKRRVCLGPRLPTLPAFVDRMHACIGGFRRR